MFTFQIVRLKSYEVGYEFEILIPFSDTVKDAFHHFDMRLVQVLLGRNKNPKLYFANIGYQEDDSTTKVRNESKVLKQFSDNLVNL